MAPILGYGSQIQYSTNGGVSYNSAIGQVHEIVLPNPTTNDVDISYIGMGAPWRLFMAGLSNPGDAELKILFDKTVFATLYAIIRVTEYWKMTYSDLGLTASTLVWAGYIKDITQEQPLDAVCMANFKMKVTNQPIFTPGT